VRPSSFEENVTARQRVSEDLYLTLRRLVSSDPQNATKLLTLALDDNDPSLANFFARISNASEARLRQLTAVTARTRPPDPQLIELLRGWRESEADEFTRRSIEAALAASAVMVQPSGPTTRSQPDPAFLQAYRYASDRLKHRIRNAVLGAYAQLMKAQAAATHSETAELQNRLAQLSDWLRTIGRAVEAIDVEPDYFEERLIHLPDWLAQMNDRFSKQYTPVKLTFSRRHSEREIVNASDYLLDTIFWNIWANAQQAVQEGLEIALVIDGKGREIEMTVLDNGPGIPRSAVGVAFVQEFSTKSVHRGRGLLEIAEAVQRLQGSVQLLELDGRLRLQLKLPVGA